MFKVFLITTGLLSFSYFLFPSDFSKFTSKLSDSSEKVLGITSINQNINKTTVYNASLAFCLSRGKPPKSLNELYISELLTVRKLDLESLYYIENFSDCSFQIHNK